MSESRRFTRRQVVSLATTSTTVAMAGCLSSLNKGSNTYASKESHHGSPSSGDNASSGEHKTGNSQHSETSTDGHSHGGGIGPATKSATVQMLTTGGIGNVLTGQTNPVSFITKNRNHFEPHIVHIAVGGTVTWVNKSGRHGVAAYHPRNDRQRRIPKAASSWSSGPLTTGESFSQTLSVEGIYDYYCPPHEGMGMIGSIVVGNPSIKNQPGLTPPANMPTSKASTKLKELNKRTRTALASEAEGSGSEHGHGPGPENDSKHGHESETETSSNHGHTTKTNNNSEHSHTTTTNTSSEQGHGTEEDGHSHGGK
jgi:plastocyanin